MTRSARHGFVFTRIEQFFSPGRPYSTHSVRQTGPLTSAMPKRQAQAGEVSEGVEAVYIHGEEAAAEVAADICEGIREMVAVNLLPSMVYSLVYGGHAFPTIKNVDTLRCESQF